MSSETWRLIVEPVPRDGAMNMAVDEAILEAVLRGDAPPTLRLYAWDPSCLSLGYGQHASDVDVARLAERGWQVVRRLTGGRAILHTDELTYSVTLPALHPLAAGSIVDSYRRISAALLDAVQIVGLDAHAVKRIAPAATVGPVCFEVPSDYEITADGKKLIGSAQVRRQGAVLQHGTLPLYGDVSRICDALVFADDAERAQAKERVLARATTLGDALGASIGWDQAAQTVIRAFADKLSLNLDPGALTADERQCAEELRVTRYAADEWNLRRR